MMNKFLVFNIIFIVLISISLKVDGAATTNKEEPESSVVPKIFNYGEYVERFGKNYSPLETLSKARLFFGRTLKIFQHNFLYKVAKKTYYLNQNQFTDIPGDELKTKYLSNESLSLKQVVEANDNPNKPASSVVGEAPEGAEDDDIGYSSCAVGSGGNCDVDHDENKGETILDFFADQDVDNLSGTIAKLKARPELAEEMASIVGIKNTALLEELRNLEDIRKSNMIERKPVVRSNNENYDPETIVSYGLFSRRETELTAENYARFLMDDEYALEPYPINDDFDSDDNDVGRKGSNLKNLLGTVKNIFDFFTDTDLDYDWNQPVDEDEEEIKDKNANKKDSSEVNNSPVEGTIIYDVDWRKTGCISKPKTQLSCNSCYAFTTLSLMEYFYCSQTKELTEFSAQYVVDCGPRFKLAGCKGGKISGVGTFIKKFGLELETMYPYLGKENQCPIPEGDSEKEERAGYLKPEITHWHNFPEMTAWYKWLPKSPIIVGINMPSDFLAYGGGIHDGTDCSSEMVHALLLVGSGAQDGKKFWLLKNSFSDSWGENGYVRVSKDAPLRCFNTATVVRVKFEK